MNSICEKIKDQIADLVTGILPETQMQKLVQHLNECAACRDYARALKDEDMLLTEFFAKIDTNITHQQERVLQAINHYGVSKQSETHLIWRTIMKNPIMKLAVAAAVIAVVVLGLVEFIGTGSKSGVVWAEVVQKVEASRGSASRVTISSPGNAENCTLFRRSPTHYRADMYAGDMLTRTICVDLEAKTRLLLAHDAKVWFREELNEQDAQTIRDEWTTPENYVKRFLSGGYRELGQRRIEGALCEGVEVTDAAVLEVNGPVRGELWVSVETGYPVLVRVEMTGGEDGQQRQVVTVDLLRWDAEYDESEFEVEIPPDYRPM